MSFYIAFTAVEIIPTDKTNKFVLFLDPFWWRDCMAEKWKTCFLLVDLDECERGDHDCHKYGVCHNEIGSYTCHCQFGYVGNGTWCEGTVLSWTKTLIFSYGFVVRFAYYVAPLWSLTVRWDILDNFLLVIFVGPKKLRYNLTHLFNHSFPLFMYRCTSAVKNTNFLTDVPHDMYWIVGMSFQLVQNILYGSRHHLTFMIAGVNTFSQEIQNLIHAEDKQKVIHERK